MSKVLEVQNLVSGYGNKQVLNRINLYIREKEIVVMVGHNGSGKTTALHSIFGLLPIWEGEVRLFQERIDQMQTDRIVSKGMALTPQGHGVFPRLTVEENLELASFTVRDRKRIAQRKSDIYAMFPILFERKHQKAGTMSGGQQQMLAIGMALMSNPKVLLLDEPSIGLAPVIVENLMNSIKEICEQFDTSVLLVEQNVKQALRIADRVYAMKMGEIVAEESAANLTKESLWNMF
jgi:branched-chain amino acid transport system ATP-binding protein